MPELRALVQGLRNESVCNFDRLVVENVPESLTPTCATKLMRTAQTLRSTMLSLTFAS